MCGIAGILNLDGRPVEADEVRAITRPLAHRGPDGEGVHLDGPLGLGHRRLAVLDLSAAGEQPMPCGGGRYWITYNGEVFNFVELRRELEACGQHFTSDTDTEVIGAAYHQWGPDCVLRFNGMWAFALWDARRRELFVSRDRFGIKPLHYLAEPGRFVFASELKAFPHLPGFTPRENEQAIRRALLAPALTDVVGDTFLQGVRRLRGGQNMLVSAAGMKVWRWWRTLDHLETPPRTLAEQTERFRELFFDACRLRLRSDVPVATCLSGGVDSSAVLCTLAALRRGAGGTERQARDYQRAFVATFPGTPRDEQAYAELAVRQAGADPRYRPVTAEMALENLERYSYDFEAIGQTLLIPLWCIYRELRRDGAVVSLDGHGADEMLAGYIHYLARALRLRGSLLRAPRRTLDLVRTVHGMYDGPAVSPGLVKLLADSDRLLRGGRRLLNLVTGPARRAASRFVAAGPSRPAEPPWVAPLDEECRWLDGDEEAEIDALGPINAQMYREFHYTRLPNILTSFDRCSMAHGVEVRMPFLDWRLVCFTFGLPEESKVGGGFTKRVLREAMRGVLPEGVRTRRGKIGFQSPLPDWFREGLGDWALEQVRTASFVESPIWNGPAIRDFVAARQRTREWALADCYRVWPFLQAHLWRQLFVERPAARPPERAGVVRVPQPSR